MSFLMGIRGGSRGFSRGGRGKDGSNKKFSKNLFFSSSSKWLSQITLKTHLMQTVCGPRANFSKTGKKRFLAIFENFIK